MTLLARHVVRYPKVEFDARELISAFEVANVLLHPISSFFGIASANRIDQPTLRSDDARACLGHLVDHAAEGGGEKAGEWRLREHQDVVLSAAGEGAEEFDDDGHGALALCREGLELSVQALQALQPVPARVCARRGQRPAVR